MKGQVLGTQLAVGATMIATDTQCVATHFWDDPSLKAAIVMLLIAACTYGGAWLRDNTRKDRRATDKHDG